MLKDAWRPESRLTRVALSADLYESAQEATCPEQEGRMSHRGRGGGVGRGEGDIDLGHVSALHSRRADGFMSAASKISQSDRLGLGFRHGDRAPASPAFAENGESDEQDGAAADEETEDGMEESQDEDEDGDPRQVVERADGRARENPRP